MAAKDVLKHWVTRIDNALLKEEKRRGTHHAPAPSAPGEPSPTRREAVVAEDMHIGETDTTTLRSAIQSLRDHTTVPVDIDAIFLHSSPNRHPDYLAPHHCTCPASAI